jgi:hypothetical protein
MNSFNVGIAKCKWLLSHGGSILLGLVLIARCAGEPVIILDPVFYRTPITEPIADSKHTVIAYYNENSDGSVTPLQAANLVNHSLTETRTAALAHARTLFRQLEVTLVRDDHDVVVAVRLESTDPALSSILLLPELRTAFSQFLGKEYLACAPTRFAIFFFPRIGENLEPFASDIETFYHNSTWPISTELFTWSGDQLAVEQDFERNN